jgi:nicotinate-nucleotide pyrophosphorylase (carboxylating)
MLEVEAIVRRALAEDVGTGDITTTLTISPQSKSKARIVAREDGIIAGLPIAALVFSLAAESYGTEGGQAGSLVFIPSVADGDPAARGDSVAEIEGLTRVILTGERTALNILQRLSGIASSTAQLVSLVQHTKARIVDTRKTTPGLRILEKYAVRCGGGGNHRFGLYDAILIKDNHVQAAGGIAPAIERARAAAPHTIKIEIEADTLDQVEQALGAGADMILLDNMTVSTIREAVVLCAGRAITEASGGITKATIAAIAETGVDLISVGALTHSVRALDLSLEVM